MYAKVEEPEGQNSTLKKLGGKYSLSIHITKQKITKNNIQCFIEYLIEEFAAEGYLKKENRPLKVSHPLLILFMWITVVTIMLILPKISYIN